MRPATGKWSCSRQAVRMLVARQLLWSIVSSQFEYPKYIQLFQAHAELILLPAPACLSTRLLLLADRDPDTDECGGRAWASRSLRRFDSSFDVGRSRVNARTGAVGSSS